MIAIQNQIINNVPLHNPKGRYFVNKIVSLGGFIYQNITGANGDPTLEIDWAKQPVSTTSFNKILQWDGTSTIPVPNGYSGTVYNQSTTQFCTYSVSGTILTITGNASGGDILQLTSN